MQRSKCRRCLALPLLAVLCSAHSTLLKTAEKPAAPPANSRDPQIGGGDVLGGPPPLPFDDSENSEDPEDLEGLLVNNTDPDAVKLRPIPTMQSLVDDMKSRGKSSANSTSAGNSSVANATRSANGTRSVNEQLLHVQLEALKRENAGLRQALVRSQTAAAGLDARMGQAESRRASAESELSQERQETQRERELMQSGINELKTQESLKEQQLEQVQQAGSETEHALKKQLGDAQNRSTALQLQLQRLARGAEASRSAARKKQVRLSHELQKVAGKEARFQKTDAVLTTHLKRMEKAVARLRERVSAAEHTLRKSEEGRLRAEGALARTEAEQADRRGSEVWFEAQVATLQESLQNATRSAQLAREARDTEAQLLDVAQHDKAVLESNLTTLRKSFAKHERWWNTTVDELHAEQERMSSNASSAWATVADLRNQLKAETARTKEAQRAAQEAANSSDMAHRAAAEATLGAQRDKNDADLAAGRAATRAAHAEAEVKKLQRKLQAAQQERNELKAYSKQQLQTAHDLAAEVRRLHGKVVRMRNQLESETQQANTLKAEFDAVKDLDVPRAKANNSTRNHSSSNNQSTEERLAEHIWAHANSSSNHVSRPRQLPRADDDPNSDWDSPDAPTDSLKSSAQTLATNSTNASNSTGAAAAESPARALLKRSLSLISTSRSAVDLARVAARVAHPSAFKSTKPHSATAPAAESAPPGPAPGTEASMADDADRLQSLLTADF